MFFLIRVAFWLSIVILLLPTGKVERPAQGPQFDTADAISAASAAFSDLGQFCARQPGACEKGSQAAVAFGQKAQASAKMLYEFFTDRTGNDGVAPAPPKAPENRSADTLTASDRAPAWRGPPRARQEHYAGRAS